MSFYEQITLINLTEVKLVVLHPLLMLHEQLVSSSPGVQRGVYLPGHLS